MTVQKFLLTTNPGIEDIVKREVLENMDAKVIYPFMNLQGRVLVETEEKNKSLLLKLRSIYHAIRYIGSFEISPEEEGLETIYKKVYETEIPEIEDVESFRVTSKRIGIHSFKSVDIQKIAGKAVLDRYKKKVDLKNYDVEIIVDVIGKRCWIGVNLTKESLYRRFERPFNHFAAIKPPLAYAMLRLADIQTGNLLLDPMCGGGTIPIEAAQVYGSKIRIFGSDSSKTSIEGAKKNAEAAGIKDLVQFCILDVREIDRVFKKVDRIVTNPPYGVRMGEWKKLKSFYAEFLEVFYKVLPEDGILVLITLRATSFRSLVFRSRHFTISHERVVEAGGLYPHIFVLRKI